MFKHDKHRNTLDRTYVGQNARLEELSKETVDEDKVSAAKGAFKYYISMFSRILDPPPPPP